jgi:hypothetical protein
MTITTIAEYPTTGIFRSGLIRRQVEWSHAAVEMMSGLIRTTQLWVYPRAFFEIQYQVIDDLTVIDLQSFYNAVAGSLTNFLFQDWFFLNPKNEIVAAGDGIRTQFKIFGDQFDSIVVRIAGVPTTPATTTPSTGFFTMGAPPAVGALVTVDVTNEKYRVNFTHQFASVVHRHDPFMLQHLGGNAYQLMVRLLQVKTIA